MDITFKPIGIVHTQATDDEIKTSPQTLTGELEIEAEFEAALEGIEGYSHLFLLSYLHRLRSDQRGPLQVKPRRLLQRGLTLEELPLLGVFAMGSPTRPNPIALSLLRLVKREGRRLIVEGLDLFDGTPILDIKGYSAGYRAEKYSVPEWREKMME